MTDQYDGSPQTPLPDVSEHSRSGPPELLSRRAVLRGATATVPTILTLASGAALARSSNLISTTRTAPAGDVLCLDPRTTSGMVKKNPNLIDLGQPPYAEVTRIPLKYGYQAKDTAQALTAPEVCQFNGTVQVNYGDGYWRDKSRRSGVFVSNAACASFAGRIVITDI